MLRLVVFLALLAAVVYAVFWLIDRRSKGRGSGGVKPIKPGPVGPDDDEEFLRQLERRSRHARERNAKKPGDGHKPPGTTPPKRPEDSSGSSTDDKAPGTPPRKPTDPGTTPDGPPGGPVDGSVNGSARGRRAGRDESAPDETGQSGQPGHADEPVSDEDA